MKKQNKRNKLTRITLALLLILSMLGNTLVLPAVAVEGTAPTDETVLPEPSTQDREEAIRSGLSDSNLSEAPNSLSQSDGDFLPLEEDESLRDAFTKHYVDPDGYRYAVIYPEQVHYNANGEWVEVDNTLMYDSVTERYVSSNDMFTTKFSKNALSDQLVSITDGDYTLSWTVSFVNGQAAGTSPIPSISTKATMDLSASISSAVGIVTNNRKLENETTHTRNVSNIGKASSAIRYNNVFNNSVDLRYSVLHGKVEEDIILNSPDNFTSYILSVNTNGLVATKQADNSIWFVNDKNETVFTLAAPWMKDSAVAVSDDIEVSVLQKGEYAYIAYTPNAQWLNDESRVYPVLIDPSFTTRYYTNNYEDTYVYTGDIASSTRPTETMLPVGKLNGINHYTYIKILNIPTLLGYPTIDEAYFDFWVNTNTSLALDIYEVEGTWSPNTITYASQPASHRIDANIYGSSITIDSSYRVDLTNWLNNIYYDYDWAGDISAFFESDSWNGFKIGCSVNGEGYYSRIYSSEYAGTSYRPTLTIKYSYTPPSYLEDGMVVEIVNAADGSRMTVHNGSSQNGTNIYQSDSDNSLAQAFKFVYNPDSNAFRIRALCNPNAPGSVLDFEYGETINSAGYSYSNLKLYEYSSARADNQEWFILPNGYDQYAQTYRIVSCADPNLALTWCGFENGTANGTTSTSPGNIYVSEYTGSSNQRWWITTSGSFLLTGINIKTSTSSKYECPENTHRYTFTCPVSNFGDSVSWSTSNPYVATVSSGRITCLSAGEAWISATIFHLDGSQSTPYRVKIYTTKAEGVYCIYNVDNGYRLGHHGYSSISDEENIEMWNAGVPTTEPSARYAMFKFGYLGDGLYLIRSMLRSDVALCHPNGGLLMSKKITYDLNNNINTDFLWRIHSDENGYYFTPKFGDYKTITSPQSPTSGTRNVLLSHYTGTNSLQNWTLYPIETHYHGVEISNKIDTIVLGENYKFEAISYSSWSHENGHGTYIWSVVDGEELASIDEESGVLTTTGQGVVTIEVSYQHANAPHIEHWSRRHTFRVIPVAEGTYYLMNADGTMRYMQVSADSSNAIGASIETGEFTEASDQKWIFSLVEDGYYKITSEESGLALSAPFELGGDIVQTEYVGAYVQQWYISKTNYKRIKISPRSSANSYIAASTAFMWPNDEDVRLSQGSNIQTDEWYIGEEKIYVFNVNMYYDKGYFVRHGESEDDSVDKLDSYIYAVADFYYEVFGIVVNYNTASYYSSKVDWCKGSVNLTNIDNECKSNSGSHSECNVLFDTIHNHFKNRYPGNATTTSAYWTGHLIRTRSGDDETNRSYSSDYQVYILEYSFYEVDRDTGSIGVLLHELNHQLGASDHYHEDAGDGCRNSELCYTCNPLTGRPESCIMNKSEQPLNTTSTICQHCKDEIKEHLLILEGG